MSNAKKILSDKTIKHISLKMGLQKSLSGYALKDKGLSLLFLTQGFDSKDFRDLRALISKFGIEIKQIPRSSWSNSIFYKTEYTPKISPVFSCSNILKDDKKRIGFLPEQKPSNFFLSKCTLKPNGFIKNKIFGDLILLSPKSIQKNVLSNLKDLGKNLLKSKHKDKKKIGTLPMISPEFSTEKALSNEYSTPFFSSTTYLYKQIVNYLIYTSKEHDFFKKQKWNLLEQQNKILKNNFQTYDNEKLFQYQYIQQEKKAQEKIFKDFIDETYKYRQQPHVISRKNVWDIKTDTKIISHFNILSDNNNENIDWQKNVYEKSSGKNSQEIHSERQFVPEFKQKLILPWELFSSKSIKETNINTSLTINDLNNFKDFPRTNILNTQIVSESIPQISVEERIWTQEGQIKNLIWNLAQNNLIYTGICTTKIFSNLFPPKKKKNGNNSKKDHITKNYEHNSNTILHLEQFNPHLYTDFSLEKVKNQGEVFLLKETPYDLILSRSIEGIDCFYFKIEGINSKFLLGL